MPKTAKMAQGNQSLHRGFDILEMLVNARDPLTIKEIADRMEMSLSAVHALLHTMVERGYAEHLGPRQGYVIGSAVTRLGKSISIENQLISLGKLIVDQVSHAVGDETCYLGYFHNMSVPTLVTRLSTRLLGLGRSSVTADTLHTASMGKLLLAYMEPEAYAEWKMHTKKLDAATPFAIRTFDALEAELSKVRAQGYAINNQESEDGVWTIAYPIFDHTGSAIACLATGFPLVRYSQDKESLVHRELFEQSSLLSDKLGYSHASREKNAGGV